MRYLTENPAVIISIIALVVSILSWLASVDNANSARRSANLSERVAEGSRPRLDIEITHIDEIISKEGVFQSNVHFEVTNRGERVAKEYSHKVIYLYAPKNVASLSIDDYVGILSAVPDQFTGGEVHKDQTERIIQQIAGETKQALSGNNEKITFYIQVIVAVSYIDELTQNEHWSIETQSISTSDLAEEIVATPFEGDDFVIRDVLIGRTRGSSMRT